jgi:hypothetical protein
MPHARVQAAVYIPLVAAELVELVAVREDDESDFRITEDGELVRLLEQTVLALGEGHLPVDLVLDPLQLDPSPPHGWALADDRPSTAARPVTNRSKQASLTPARQAKQKQSERGLGNAQEVSERERRGRVRRSVPEAADQTVTMPDRRTGRRA